MKPFITLLLLAASASVWAQMDPEPVVVQIIVNDSAYTIEKSSSQTEQRNGWNVVGYNVGAHSVKYFWGATSRQWTESRHPCLIINPVGATLSDYVIIRLKKKKGYRQLPEAILRNNDYLTIDLVHFTIQVMEDERFRVVPQSELPAGEYVLLNLNQTPHGDLADYYGFCFTVE